MSDLLLGVSVLGFVHCVELLHDEGVPTRVPDVIYSYKATTIYHRSFLSNSQACPFSQPKWHLVSLDQPATVPLLHLAQDKLGCVCHCQANTE